MPIQIPDPNPFFYVLPDTPAPGIFSRKAVQDDVAAGMQRNMDTENADRAKAYLELWKRYKDARDNNNGMPVATVPEPTPDPMARLVRDKDNNPGWFEDLSTPCTPVQVYTPPNFHPADQLGTTLLKRNCPAGDKTPVGYSFTDWSGNFGPAGVTWVKVAEDTPFGTAIYYQGSQRPNS